MRDLIARLEDSLVGDAIGAASVFLTFVSLFWIAGGLS